MLGVKILIKDELEKIITKAPQYDSSYLKGEDTKTRKKMINKKIRGLIKETNGGLAREFFPCGAAVWIPVALFVLLVLFQMVPLPAVVLKVVSPATYALYEEILPEVGKRQRSEVRSRLATDSHRLTQTFVRRTSPDKNGHRFAKRQKTEGQEKDEHRTSNIERPTSNEKQKKMKQKTEGREQETGSHRLRRSHRLRPLKNASARALWRIQDQACLCVARRQGRRKFQPEEYIKNY